MPARGGMDGERACAGPAGRPAEPLGRGVRVERHGSADPVICLDDEQPPVASVCFQVEQVGKVGGTFASTRGRDRSCRSAADAGARGPPRSCHLERSSHRSSHLTSRARVCTQHPLALLLTLATVLAWASGTPRLAVAIVAVILLNASFSFVQELQAERAVEALAAFLPERARVLRDGTRQDIEARLLVPGDVLLIEEGDRICADARLIIGTVEVDMATLTCESVPVIRSADSLGGRVPLLQAQDLVFSGSECTGGEAHAVVTATGMGTELGRIAALSQRGARGEPARAPGQAGGLADRVRGGRSRPGVPAHRAGGRAEPGRGDQLRDRAAGGQRPGSAAAHDHARAGGRVREMARRGALVKRLSAVETLGSTSVICTDKTGTLTQNRMRVTRVWTPDGETSTEDQAQPPEPGPGCWPRSPSPAARPS